MNSPSTEPKQIRIFGAVAVMIFFLFGANMFFKQNFILLGLFVFLWVQALGFLLFPRLMTPVYKGWLKVAEFFGRIVNTVLLTLMFYLGITPFAIFKRIFKIGGPNLPLKPDPEVKTYWAPRKEAAQPRKRFLKRY